MVRPSSQSKLLAVLLTALSAFGPVSIDMYLPSLPSMVAEFHTSISQVQLTLSMFITGFAVGTLFLGPISDRYGRRPVIIGGCLIYTVASIACLWAPNIEILTMGRFVQAVGAAAGPVIGRAVVRDVYPRQDAARLMSYMASAIAVAPAVGPILGGWLQSLYGWQANFYLFSGFGLLMLLGSWSLLGETNPARGQISINPLKIIQTYGLLMKSRYFIGHTLIVALVFSGLFSFLSGGSFLIIDLMGVAERNFGFVFMCVVAGFLSGALLSGTLNKKIGTLRTIELGSVVNVVACLLAVGCAALGLWRLPGLPGLASVVVPMALYFMSAALMLPNATAQVIAPYGSIAGAVSSLLGFLQMGLGAIAGAVVGMTFHDDAFPMMAQVAVLGIAGVLSYRLLIGRRSFKDLG